MRRHELDPISLTFGFAFAALGLLFLLGQADQALRLRWVWPLFLLALGGGILLDIAVRRPRETPDPEVEPEVAPGPAPAPGVASPGDPAPEVASPGDPAPEVASDPDAWPAAPESTAAPEADPAVDKREHPS